MNINSRQTFVFLGIGDWFFPVAETETTSTTRCVMGFGMICAGTSVDVKRFENIWLVISWASR